MRHFITSAALALALGAPLAAVDTYDVDATHTSTLFKINHLGASNFWGRFNDVSGGLTWDNADVSKSAITITIKADSIDTNQKDRDGHLRGPDFFNTKQFPTFTFVSKSFAKDADANYTVTGDLTLAGTTKPLTLKVIKVGEVDVPKFGHRIGLDTTFTIKRSDFGIKGVPGVGDEVVILIAIEAVRK